MILPEFFLLATFWNFIWGLLAVVAVIVGVLLVTVILVQDSKDAGLTGAFGGGASSALMGARMQKGLARFTTALAIIFGVSVLVMGKIDHEQRQGSAATQGDSPTELRAEADTSADAAGAGGSALPPGITASGLLPGVKILPSDTPVPSNGAGGASGTTAPPPSTGTSAESAGTEAAPQDDVAPESPTPSTEPATDG